jgi:hypothetical protein
MYVRGHVQAVREVRDFLERHVREGTLQPMRAVQDGVRHRSATALPSRALAHHT